MADALRSLCSQPRPSEVTIPGLLDGLDRVKEGFKAFTDPEARSAAA
jgi:hypothetical protein